MNPPAVLVAGLGVTGLAVVEHFAAAGGTVVAAEDRPEAPRFAERAESARRLGARVVTAPADDGWPALLDGVDLVVPSPGVAPRHPLFAAAAAAGVPVRSEIDVAAEVAARSGRPALAAVTGTNGKTTVTTLAADVLDRAGRRVIAAGNLGPTLLRAVSDPDVEVVVAEVSSFQLAFTTVFRPAVACWTNLAPDHLDWHPTVDDYAAAKARIFEHQQPDDAFVYNADDPVVTAWAARAPSRLVPFTIAPGGPAGAYRLDGDELRTDAGERIVRRDELATTVPHDVANALAAAAVAGALGAPLATVADTLRAAARLPHRVTFVGQARGVRYFDDSKATNPHATLGALRGFDRVVLVAGGLNKGIDLSVLRSAADRLRAVVAIGQAAPELVEVFSGVVPVITAASMDAAVAAAAERAEPGDVVLLSPACASFDWYTDYAARGDDFARAVQARAGAEA